MHAPFGRSAEVLQVYETVGWGMNKKVYVYDWARVYNEPGTQWQLIRELSTLGNYKTIKDDGFGNAQIYIHVINSTKYLISTQKWVNKIYLYNYTTPAGSWDLKYSYEYPDYNLNIGGSVWAGNLEYETTINGGNNPPAMKEFGYKDQYRIFNNVYGILNNTNSYFSNYNPPNNTVVNNRIANYT